jgi:hypothetical protein
MTRLLRIVGGVSFLGLPLLLSTNGCTGTQQVREIFMSLDGSGARVRDTFFTDSTQIFCDIAFAGADPDTTVTATFEQLSGEPTLFDGSGSIGPVAHIWNSSELAPAAGEQILSFVMGPPQPVSGGAKLPFPVGDWKCIVTVNGQAAGDTKFKVIYPTPDCPPAGVASNQTNCTAYKLNDQCPTSNNFNNTTACTCVDTPPAQVQTLGLRSWSCTE